MYLMYIDRVNELDDPSKLGIGDARQRNDQVGACVGVIDEMPQHSGMGDCGPGIDSMVSTVAGTKRHRLTGYSDHYEGSQHAECGTNACASPRH